MIIDRNIDVRDVGSRKMKKKRDKRVYWAGVKFLIRVFQPSTPFLKRLELMCACFKR